MLTSPVDGLKLQTLAKAGKFIVLWMTNLSILLYMCAPRIENSKYFIALPTRKYCNKLTLRYNHQENVQFIFKEVVYILKNKYVAKGLISTLW